ASRCSAALRTPSRGDPPHSRANICAMCVSGSGEPAAPRRQSLLRCAARSFPRRPPAQQGEHLRHVRLRVGGACGPPPPVAAPLRCALLPAATPRLTFLHGGSKRLHVP